MPKTLIWVVYDNTSYDQEYTLQLVSKANVLANETEGKVEVIYLGNEDEVIFGEIGKHGANHIVFCESFIEDEMIHAEIIAELILEKHPNMIIFPATQYGKLLASYLSSKFEAGLTADCIDIQLDEDGKFIFCRAAINESVIAQIKCMNTKYEMCTVKKGVFPKQLIDGYKAIEVEKWQAKEADLKNIPLREIMSEHIIEKENTIDLSSAKIVFAIGRGVKTERTLELIHKLAKKCHAEIIGTRAAVEEGLIESKRQVGQSGISVSPNIYVGFGISGATQHIVGIKNAKLIVAINIDEKAPIFNYADYAIVEDVNLVVEVLDKEIN